MIIDCDSCAVRGLECGDCVVTVLLLGPAELDRREQAAIAVLAEAGMLPPLRLVPNGAEDGDGWHEDGEPGADRHRAAG